MDDLLLLANRGGNLVQLNPGGHSIDGDSYGRKLHDESGRFATRVKISDISLCWTLVSFRHFSTGNVVCENSWAYKLSIEFGQTRLTGVVEDEHCVYHPRK